MPIELGAYSDRTTFGHEVETLFTRRYFVGRASDFPERDCYRSFLLGSRVITVRRTAEGLRAFGNACLHRSNLIDPLGDGKRHFSCGFHGWSYDATGALALAPMTDISCIQRRQLSTFRLRQVEDLVFLDLGSEAVDLGKLPDALTHTGITFAPSFYRGSLTHRCNWKLLVDNVLESYHLNFVHRDTFLKSGFTSTSTHTWRGDDYVNTASIEPLPATSKLKTLQRLARKATHLYKHAYVFPNLLLSSTNDLIGYVARFHPVSEDVTDLHWELFELPEMLKLPPAVREHMRGEAIEFAVKTLEEDRVMIEACQIGMASHMGDLQLQPAEDRVAHFHQHYRMLMQHAC